MLHGGRAAQKGIVIAAMFLLKARHGYREGDQGETANRVSITFALPGAMKPEQFTVENDPSPATIRIATKSVVRS